MTQAGANWYYAIGTERNGPIDITSLRQLLASGRINANTLVWTDGLPNWIAAISHPDLAVAAHQQMQGMQTGGGGYNTSIPYAPGQTLQYYGAPQEIVYAGFWLRLGAWLLDLLITAFGGCIVGGFVGLLYGVSSYGKTPGSDTGLQIVAQLLGAIVGWLYYALMESSSAQATLGKMACGIKVIDVEGQRISFGRATGRHFAKIISGIILAIGYMMAGWTERKQALHDIMAGTLVIRK